MQDLAAPLSRKDLNGANGSDDMMEDGQAGPTTATLPILSLDKLMSLVGRKNCADLLDEDDRKSLAEKAVREYKIDKESRSSWEEQAKRALAAAKQNKENKSFPWPNASNVKFPMLTTAALQFAARAYPAIVDGPLIVKVKPLGADPNGLKAAMARRTSQHMSFQLLHELQNWEEDMDTLLHQLPVVGTGFKKCYHDPVSEAGLCIELVSGIDMVINNKARSMDRVPRFTHVFTRYPNEIEEKVRANIYLPLPEGAEDKKDDDSEHPQTFIEQHRNYDFDGDGYAEPWIVTVHEQSQTLVRMVANWRPQGTVTDQSGGLIKLQRREYFVKYDFIPDPEGGLYSIGFGKLLEALSDVVDTSINQMMDAGTLQNAGGGFIGSGLKLGKSRIRFRPGEYQTVEMPGPDLRNAIVSMQHPGPSSTLFQLLSLMIDAGKDIAAIQDILVGDMPRNQTATTTMAMIEQGLKVFTAIYKRIFRSLKREYKLIYEINREYLDQVKYVDLLDEPVQVIQADYHDKIDVMPVADPKLVTDMQRMALAQFYMEQVASGNPIVNAYEGTKRAYEVVGVPDIDKILIPPKPTPQDQLMMRGAVAEVVGKEADAAKTQAEAVLAQAEAEQVQIATEDQRFAKNVTSEISSIINPEMQGASDAMPAEAGPAPPVQMPMLPPDGMPPPQPQQPGMPPA